MDNLSSHTRRLPSIRFRFCKRSSIRRSLWNNLSARSNLAQLFFPFLGRIRFCDTDFQLEQIRQPECQSLIKNSCEEYPRFRSLGFGPPAGSQVCCPHSEFEPAPLRMMIPNEFIKEVDRRIHHALETGISAYLGFGRRFSGVFFDHEVVF